MRRMIIGFHAVCLLFASCSNMMSDASKIAQKQEVCDDISESSEEIMSTPTPTVEPTPIPEPTPTPEPTVACSYSISGLIANLGEKNEAKISCADIFVECNADGSFQINNLQPGTYTLIPEVEDASISPVSSVVEIIDGDITGVTFAIDGQGWDLQLESEFDQSIRDIISTSDSYIIAGYASFAASGEDIDIVSLNLNGVENWRQSLGAEGDDQAVAIAQRSDACFYVVANDVCYDSYQGLGGRNIRLLLLDTSGEITQDTLFGGIYADSAASVCVGDNDCAVVVGYTLSHAQNGASDWIILYYDEACEVDRYKIFGEGGHDKAIGAVMLEDGSLVVCGSMYDSATGKTLIKLMHLDSKGEELRSQFFYSEYNEHPSALYLKDNTIYISGYAEERTGGSSDGLLIVADLSFSGTTYYYGAEEDMKLNDLYVNESGTVLLTGYTKKLNGYKDSDFTLLSVNTLADTSIIENYDANTTDDEAFTITTSAVGGFVIGGHSFVASSYQGRIVYVPEKR